MDVIKSYITNNQTDILNEICQYNVWSAWFDVDFGGCPYGVFSAAMPVESLHALGGGLIKDILSILFQEDLKELNCQILDFKIRKMTKWDRQFYLTAGTNNTFPRLLFKDGVSTLSKISSRHIVSEMLAILVFALTDTGIEFFHKIYYR